MNVIDIYEKGPVDTIFEKRMQNPDHCEWVVLVKDLSSWQEYFTGLLGDACKPVNEKPDTDQQQIAAPFGGIYQEQTLFVCDQDKERVVAMFWPWQDKTNVTIKLYCSALIEL
ncbi:hypothetical protein K8S19_09115 [bacterium]|nr:hypothetical protein [bacterium]